MHMTIKDLTTPVAANQLAASAFLMKMTTKDLTSPVAATQLDAGRLLQALFR